MASERTSKTKTAKALVRKARGRVERGRKAEPTRTAYWELADRALAAVEKRKDALTGAGADLMTGFLASWADGKEEAAIAYLRDNASAAEVIQSMRRGTRQLEEETRKRTERNAALLDLAKELGGAGVRLLLAVLLAA
jgi:hypothetical protein